jgi:hypothetical protein
MRGFFAAFAVGLLLLTGAGTASAQTIDATARTGAGQSAKLTATAIPGSGVTLEIALPDGRKQTLAGLGEELIPLGGKPGDKALMVLDIDNDGIDEIFVRVSMPPQLGTLIVFRWNSQYGEFAPVEFTDERDQKSRFLAVDFALPVSIDPSGKIEAQFVSERADGRKSHYVARYRWSGDGYVQSADN